MVRRVQPLHETMSLHLGVRTGDLTAALSKRRFDILYVSGHGADDKKREGGIAFAGANKAGKLHSLSAKALGERLLCSAFFTHLAACVPRERQGHPPDINLLDLSLIHI